MCSNPSPSMQVKGSNLFMPSKNTCANFLQEKQGYIKADIYGHTPHPHQPTFKRHPFLNIKRLQRAWVAAASSFHSSRHLCFTSMCLNSSAFGNFLPHTFY
jgi:hypothetical protein